MVSSMDFTVVGGRLHRHGTGGVLGRVAVQQGGIELQAQGLGNEVLEKFGRGGFEDVVFFRFLDFAFGFARNDRIHRQERFPHGDLLAGGDEVVVDEVHAVQAALAEVIHQCARQFGSGGVGRIVGQFLVILRRGFSGLLHGFRHLASDAVHGDIGIAVGPEGFQRETDDIGIESAAKGRVGRESDEGDFLPGRCRIFILDRGPGRPFGSPRPYAARFPSRQAASPPG